jgi:predicted SprT family Zn-dependent metalloprotease
MRLNRELQDLLMDMKVPPLLFCVAYPSVNRRVKRHEHHVICKSCGTPVYRNRKGPLRVYSLTQ